VVLPWVARVLDVVLEEVEGVLREPVVEGDLLVRPVRGVVGLRAPDRLREAPDADGDLRGEDPREEVRPREGVSLSADGLRAVARVADVTPR